MKNRLILVVLVLLFRITFTNAQCTGSNFYDLYVTDTTVLHPSQNAYISAVVCSGALLIDSANCCTRTTHVLSGGTYEIGGFAYGSVYIQSGGTFNANNSTIFFGVTYEAGATILNYNGPLTLCPSITFSPFGCTTGLNEINSKGTIYVSLDAVNSMLNVVGVQTNYTLIIVDITGRIVLEKRNNIPESSMIDVSALTSGIYNYRILNNHKPLAYGKFTINR